MILINLQLKSLTIFGSGLKELLSAMQTHRRKLFFVEKAFKLMKFEQSSFRFCPKNSNEIELKTLTQILAWLP